MKNPHGVEPTRFMKRKESEHAIGCYSLDDYRGPIFGNCHIKKNGFLLEYTTNHDLYIGKFCDEEKQCYIHNDGTNAYECHPKYKSSLFVNTAGPDEYNYFRVLDYEVFGIDFESKYTIDHICKYPDIIWEYIETKDISEESLKQVDDERELLNDLDVIYCEDSAIRLKISKLCLKNPSEFLPETQLLNQQYDDKLREWLGNDYKWKLIYRASEHRYSGESFHECCNDKGPTLIVIKSSGGWIFGGYTTQLWSGNSIYNEMIY